MKIQKMRAPKYVPVRCAPMPIANDDHTIQKDNCFISILE